MAASSSGVRAGRLTCLSPDGDGDDGVAIAWLALASRTLRVLVLRIQAARRTAAESPSVAELASTLIAAHLLSSAAAEP